MIRSGVLGRRFGAVLACATLALGCARLTGTAPPAATEGARSQLHAGAASVDITPPPGFAMGGHSIEGQIARGVWTRLWARSIYLETPDGHALVLSITDLWGIPAGLADRVAEIVARERGRSQLGRDNIVLAATHTHHGPANFATHRVFSRFVGPRSGFDPTLFEFLAQRIARSITEAADEARPATVQFAALDVPGVARNRSIEPFMRNPEASTVVEAARGDVTCRLEPLTLRGPPPVDPCRAVDTKLRVLRIDAAGPSPVTMAILGVFAVHPTAMPNRSVLYSSDVFGIAAAHAEATWGAGPPPVVALFNGAEGDVSPNWAQQGRDETVRIGRILGAAVVAAATAAEPLRVETMTRAYARTPLADQPVITSDGSTARTTDRGLPGTATIGGAEDGRTRWHGRGFTEGRVARRERLPGHGPKRPPVAAGVLAMSIPRDHVPREVAIGVYGLGPLVLTTLPGEFTTVMGLRIRRSVARQLGVPARDVVALGLAHAHLEYFTTPQEYAMQHYEGSSMFYGPHAGSLVAQRSAQIAAAGDVGFDPSFAYEPGRRRSFRPRPRRLSRRDAQMLAQVLSLRTLDEHPTVTFVDDAPIWPPVDPLAPVLPDVRLEVLRDGVWESAGNTDGSDIVIVPVRRRGRRWEWMAWFVGARAGAEPARLHVTGLDGFNRCSTPIHEGAPLGVEACR